jgi:hypothetical protein
MAIARKAYLQAFRRFGCSEQVTDGSKKHFCEGRQAALDEVLADACKIDRERYGD